MARILLHTLVFSPDGVSTAYLMTDIARQLQQLGHSVIVLTTTPHYNLEPTSLDRQPMKKMWPGLVYQSECDGISVWHVKMPLKGERVSGRMLDYIRFHLISLMVVITKIRAYDIIIAPSPPLTIGAIAWLMSIFSEYPLYTMCKKSTLILPLILGAMKNPLVIKLMRKLEQFIYNQSTMIVPDIGMVRKDITPTAGSRRKIICHTQFCQYGTL